MSVPVIKILPASVFLALGFTWGVASPASAGETFSVTGTDIGIYPRTAPSMDADRVGTALADNTSVDAVCELQGQVVDNGYAPSSIWMRLTDGTFLPNAFVLTGYDGRTPSLPSCEEPSTNSEVDAESPEHFEGIAITNDRVSTQLINHYYDGTGTLAVVDWSFFEQSDRFMSWLQTQPIDGIGRQYESNPVDDGEIYAAVGAFSAARTSEHCYVMKDRYDFTPNKPANIPYIFTWADTVFGGAAEFTVRSSGCIY